ncbi:MAG: hydrogenase formation protein HypD [Geminocystis sp.]|nr:hydrogenase formation protein HypD [Geminocystis sp.]MCX8078358.1 hydrogenase formation protein HypD [Geminocystis sp.]MDW8116083.1 hydrogenase formation protein HypD [Geminocystis sp.]
MRFVDEYRQNTLVEKYRQAIQEIITQPWQIMEVCGGQTHSILKYGLDQLLPPEISLIHGPGCPVCVTDVRIIDIAVSIASQENVILCSFGDMLRVPGSKTDLLSVKGKGGDIRILYSPLDSLKIARENPHREVVFFAVGFETTAPTTAMTVYQAKRQGITNFSLLVSHVLVPPAMRAILSSPQCKIQGFLAAGHVCTVRGYHEYESICHEYKIPIVVTGFEPLDIIQGIYMCIQQLENKTYRVENQYRRCVKKEGNILAKKIVEEVFETSDYNWRGIGIIPNSGLKLRKDYASFDCILKFGISPEIEPHWDDNPCIGGEILQGIKKPYQCEAFGLKCTPENPLGAPMVSSEGACAAYYRYRYSS